MNQSLKKYINEFFTKLTEVYGFNVKTELDEQQSYMIEYSSRYLIINIQKYFREFYVTLYKKDVADSEVNLFNLLDYLMRGHERIPKSEYFKSEKDIEECHKKQLHYNSSVIYENFSLINEFFYDDRYELNMAEFERYWKKKHPELYKGI